MRAFDNVVKYIKNTDMYLLMLSIIASGYGLTLIYTATRSYETNKFIMIQGIGICLGLIGFIIISLINFENIASAWKWVFVLNLILQASVMFIGTAGGGNRSWIRFGPIGIQPGEIGKILFIFTFAQHIAIVKDKISHPKYLFQLLAHMMILAGAVVVCSKDDGMAISYVFIGVIMLFCAGLSLKWFLAGIILAVSSIPFLWNFVLGTYQKNRILVLFDPSLNPDISYQGEQSKLAIGAGQMFGAGYMNGNQTQYSLLPAKHTDFIFAVGAEELGFIGAMTVVFILMLIILRLFYVSYKADNNFCSQLCVGIAGMFLFQTFENIFMCIGVGPVMGLTLPFFSYGGTSVVTMFIALGIAAGVRMQERPTWLK